MRMVFSPLPRNRPAMRSFSCFEDRYVVSIEKSARCLKGAIISRSAAMASLMDWLNSLARGCRRRVSLNRLTRTESSQSMNRSWKGTSMSFSSSRAPENSVMPAPARASTTTAYFDSGGLFRTICPKAGRRVGGMLSMQTKSMSSSISTALDFPAPESPVRIRNSMERLPGCGPPVPG